jgi:hypothetical protein
MNVLQYEPASDRRGRGRTEQLVKVDPNRLSDCWGDEGDSSTRSGPTRSSFRIHWYGTWRRWCRPASLGTRWCRSIRCAVQHASQGAS